MIEFKKLKSELIKEYEEMKDMFQNTKDPAMQAIIIRDYSTKTRKKQYKTDEINYEQMLKYATKRAIRTIDKQALEELEHIKEIERENEPKEIRLYIERGRTNPYAKAIVDGEEFTGILNNYGRYNKECIVTANVLNQSPKIEKMLYRLKEEDLRKNKQTIKWSDTLPRFSYYNGIDGMLEIFKMAGYKIEKEIDKSYIIKK